MKNKFLVAAFASCAWIAIHNAHATDQGSAVAPDVHSAGHETDPAHSGSSSESHHGDGQEHVGSAHHPHGDSSKEEEKKKKKKHSHKDAQQARQASHNNKN